MNPVEMARLRNELTAKGMLKRSPEDDRQQRAAIDTQRKTAIAILKMCESTGRADWSSLAAEFLEKNATVEQVRSDLAWRAPGSKAVQTQRTGGPDFSIPGASQQVSKLWAGVGPARDAMENGSRSFWKARSQPTGQTGRSERVR